MQITRRKILTHIQVKGWTSAAELSRLLGKTEANIRYHLASLSRDGFVEVVDQEKPSSRGRPTLVYGLGPQAQLDNLNRLIGVIWTELIGDRPSKQRLARLRRIASRLVNSSGGQRAASLPQRLYQAIERLQAMNYTASWEAHADSPRVILDQCPFAALVGNHPEVCTLDALILEELLGEPVEQVAIRNQIKKVRQPCVFQVLKTPPHNNIRKFMD